MSRVKTFTNGGSILPGDLNAIQDDYEPAFSSYKVVRRDLSASLTGLPPAGSLFGTPVYLDASDYAGGSRATKLRVRAVLFCDGVAPGVAIDIAWATVTITDMVPSFGTLVPGAVASFGTQAAHFKGPQVSTDFAAPAAGYYMFFVNLAAGQAAFSHITAFAELQLRQV